MVAEAIFIRYLIIPLNEMKWYTWSLCCLDHCDHACLGIHNAILEFEGRVHWQWRTGLRSCVTLGSYLAYVKLWRKNRHCPVTFNRTPILNM